MRFIETRIHGAFVLEPERIEDERGFFARTFCRRELAERGLVTDLAQASVSFNRLRGTLRGMHFQAAPHGETKIVSCSQGRIFDVIVDLRPESSSFRKWLGVEMAADDMRALYIPDGCAHGFVTLTDGCQVAYHISSFYEPASARGVRWNDPAFSIEWPIEPSVMSERDRAYPDFVP